jgi:FkbM family methyltransferase
MAFDKHFIHQCASLGKNTKDKCKLALFALVAPLRDRSPGRWGRMLARLIPNFWIKPRQLQGAGLLINPTDWSQTVIFEEVFLRNNYDFGRLKFSPDIVLDCGAHIGLFSLLAKSTFPQARLTAYEPNPDNIRFIRSQITGNQLDIKLVESAVSTESKVLDFIGGNSHSGKLLHNATGFETYKVSAIDFPQTVKELRPVSLLLKMDVEGEELAILPKLMPFLPRQTALFFETHSGDAGWREVESLLTSNGFQVQLINSRGLFYDGYADRGLPVT